MTKNEAHAILEDKQRAMTLYREMFANSNNKFKGLFSDDEIEANGMAILAIEKEIPKPVKKWVTEHLKIPSEYVLTYVCPSCGKLCIADTIYYKKFKPLYCVNCGQALNWSSLDNVSRNKENPT